MHVARWLVTICAVIFHVTQSTAASIERISGGYVLVKVFGETLKFREKDTPYIRLQTQLRPCVNADQALYYGPTLDRWLNDPKAAECLNSIIPDEAPKDKTASVGVFQDRIDLSIIPTFEGDVLYPGGVHIPPEVKELINTDRTYAFGSIGIYIGFGAEETCTENYAKISASSLGFAKYNSNINGPGFSISSKFRLDKNLTKDLCVSCDHINPYICGVRETSDDSAIVFRLGWNQNKKIWNQSKSKRLSFAPAEPIPEWFQFDQIAREIASNIVISRPKGTFQ